MQFIGIRRWSLKNSHMLGEIAALITYQEVNLDAIC